MIHSPIRSLALTALAGTFAFSAAFSAAPAADPAALRSPAISDVVLARSALASLDADPVLRDVNLLVSVVDRVAVVGGPVAAADHGKRAESIVRRVPGIVDVKNRCFVQESTDPLLRAMSVRDPATSRVQAADLPGVVASPKTGVVEEFTPTLGENNLAVVEPAEKSVVARRPMNPGDSVLLPPVGSRSTPAPGGTVLPAGVASPAPAPAVLTAASSNALAAAETARKADRRFAGLSVSFTNGTVVIAGTAARVSDAWDLAQELRRIPGVPRVALGAVEVK